MKMEPLSPSEDFALKVRMKALNFLADADFMTLDPERIIAVSGVCEVVNGVLHSIESNRYWAARIAAEENSRKNSAES